ncbi:mismatch-specific DNA-glycosylase [Bradyrhizobium liaoningense]|uniref:mismatch-specific DNA-glycosylase n=1 Tax=Bradyrhizobium liaoningense TaxID=43992 RepID=UPI001BA6C01C|nr:mismatch-specific DNA-glycosylase [Bradyrhizobium liaoningense]MBR1169156.1 mismatch-specific DNA-glycosylase [Bradyrhizobium liaoningense]
MTAQDADILPDLLTSNLDVVFCGTAAGRTSALKRAYYAHRRNRFWPILHECGLTDRQLPANEFAHLHQYGIGLTDLCKVASGNDDELPSGALTPARLLEAIAVYKPRYLAFTSRTAGRVVCGNSAQYGRQHSRDETQVFILPTTSSRRGDKWWDTQKRYWHEFADAVRASRRSQKSIASIAVVEE